MDTKASLHELLAAFTSDLKGTEKHLKQSITDIGSEFRGALKSLRTILNDQGNEWRAQLERQGEQIAALNTSINDQFHELQLSKEKTAGGPTHATDSKEPDRPKVEAILQPEDVIDERSARLEASIKGLNSKNLLIQWQLGIIAVSVAFPYVRSAVERILVLCQL